MSRDKLEFIHYPIKVLIVEDSLLARELLTFIINSDPHLQVMACVNTGEAALEFLKTQSPDVITMDIMMPGMNGFEATHQIMKIKPTPIIIISASYQKEDVSNSFRAISAGALDIFEKPASFNNASYAEQSKAIIQAIKMVSQVKLKPFLSSSPFSDLTSTPQLEAIEGFKNHPKIEAIALGASLGGPQALITILSQIPKHFPIPFFIVQHISAGFTQGFVDWLKKETPLDVQLAKDKTFAKPGCVYVAPEHFHMEIAKGGIVRLIDAPPEKGIRPSVGHLFRSMAYAYGPKGLGIILTGMGKDGVDDLLLMQQAGAMTIAQDQGSSLLFGMPKEAIAKKAAQYIMSPQQIARILKLIVNRPV